jgi:hypothetical protein
MSDFEWGLIEGLTEQRIQEQANEREHVAARMSRTLGVPVHPTDLETIPEFNDVFTTGSTYWWVAPDGLRWSKRTRGNGYIAKNSKHLLLKHLRKHNV